MERQRKTIESGRSPRSSMLLPAVVLVLTLILGAAASLRFSADSDPPSAPVAEAVPEVIQPPEVVEAPSAPPPQLPVESVTVEPERPAPQATVAEAVVPEAVVPEIVVPEGRAGLIEALRRGELRPGSPADIARWATAARASGQSIETERLTGGAMDVFVIEKDFVVPGRLTGAHAVIFVLDAGRPFPRGDLGHSVVLDVPSGSCIGVTCGIMLSR
jgi:hypothetical protein